MIVNQWVPAAHRGDAIGDSARRVRDLLRSMGHQADLFALTIDDDLRGDVRPFSDPASQAGDVTIFHFALISPMTRAFAALPGGRVLQYHNVTPAHFFAREAAGARRLVCDKGVGWRVGPLGEAGPVAQMVSGSMLVHGRPLYAGAP